MGSCGEAVQQPSTEHSQKIRSILRSKMARVQGTLLLPALILLTYTEIIKGDILPTGLPPPDSTGCEGSLSVHRDQELLQTVTEDEELNRKLKFDEVRMVGCGCFSLHSGKDFGGRSFLVQAPGSYYHRDVGFKKILSISRITEEQCKLERRALPSWGVILVVLCCLVLVLVGVLAARRYRLRRHHQQVQTTEQEA